MTLIELPEADPKDILLRNYLIDPNEGTDRTLAGRIVGNQFTFGKPRAANLTDIFEQQGVQIDIKSNLGTGGADNDIKVVEALDPSKYEFWLLRMVSSLEKNSNYSVKEVSVRIEFKYTRGMPSGGLILNDKTPSRAFPTQEQPWVHWLQPETVDDSSTVVQTIILSPSLELKDLAKISVGQVGVKLTYNALYPKITGQGRQQSWAKWTFLPGNQGAVREGDKQMDVIVVKLRGTLVQANVSTDGKGRTWGFFTKQFQQGTEQFFF